MISYAPNFEDVMLARVFKDKEGPGFYIDIGAMDPTDGSVTRYFYDLGWRGINIEPDTRFYEKLVAERTRDINLNIAVGEAEEVRPFYHFEAQGISTFNPTFRDYFIQKSYPHEELTCKLTTLAKICREHVTEKIDFLKIDAEGWEGPIIRGADWRMFRPVVVLLEATEPYSHIPAWQDWEENILDAGYIFVYYDGVNRFYIRQESAPLRDLFAYPPNVLDGFKTHSHLLVEQERDQARLENTRLAAQVDHFFGIADRERRRAESLSLDIEAERNRAAQLAQEKESERLRADQLAQQREVQRLRIDQLAQDKEAERIRADQLAIRADQLASRADRVALRGDQLSHEREAERIRADQLGQEKEAERIRADRLGLEKEAERIRADQLGQEKEAERIRADQLGQEKEAERIRADQLSQEKEAERIRADRLGQEKEAERVRADQLGQEKEAERCRANQLIQERDAQRIRADQLEREMEAERLRADRLKQEKLREHLWVGQLCQDRAIERIRSNQLAREKETEHAQLVELLQRCQVLETSGRESRQELDMALAALRMEAIPPLEPEDLTVRIREYPLSARAQERILVSALISNDSSHNLISFDPHPVNVSYHWWDEFDCTCVLFSGLRTSLRPFLLSHSTQEYKLLVECPPNPGKYILKVTLVQEGVRWFDEHSPALRDQVRLEIR